MYINNYVRPGSIDEAYKLLSTVENSQLIGGGVFLKLKDIEIDLAIDLWGLALDFIHERDNTIEIGAMTSFRALETSSILNKYFGSIIADSIKDIIGVQFKNSVTVGGSIYPRYGFSDLITALLVLDCKLIFYKAGEIKLEDYLKLEKVEKDILIKIILNKENVKSSFKCLRISTGDYSILNVAVSKNGNGYKVAVGARPAVATLVPKAEELLNVSEELEEELIEKAAEIAANDLSFGSNYLASEEYRREICKVLVNKALWEVK